jgi:hypothetical protein
MKHVLLLALVVVGCGGDNTCSDASGQACGPQVSVRLRYLTLQGLDAGAVPGGSDGGTLTQPDGGVIGRCSLCTITQSMPLSQYEYGVKTRVGCAPQWTSTSEVVLDCAGSCGSSGPPVGAENTACVWAPPQAP